jgi:hypothetical protein
VETSESAAMRALTEQMSAVRNLVDGVRQTAGEIRTALSEHRTTDLKTLHAEMAKIGTLIGEVPAAVEKARHTDTPATDPADRLQKALETLQALKEKHPDFDPKDVDALTGLLARFERQPDAPVQAAPEPAPLRAA